MAELVGVIASGISIGTLTVQIASSIAKLNNYWSQIKEAPEDIRMLVEEIEDLHHLLCDIENDCARNPMSRALLDIDSASRCINHCKRGADRLKELADHLENEICSQTGLKRKWASTKAVLEKNRIDKYKSRLESAVRLLSLAYQCYTRALIQQQPEIITTRMTEIFNSIQEPAKIPSVESTNADLSTSRTMTLDKEQNLKAERYTLSHSSRFEIGDYSWRRRRRKQATARYHFHATLLNRAWAVQCLSDTFGWTIQIRTYTFISGDSPILKFVNIGDLRGVQELFGKGLASPNDVDETNSWSLLEHAAFSGELEICRFLLEQGADLNLAAGSPYEALSHFSIYGLIYNQSLEAAAFGFPMLCHNMGVTTAVLKFFRGSIDAFKLLQRELEVPYYSLPLEERVEVAIGLTHYGLQNDPELIRTALGPGTIPTEAIKHQTKFGETLLHGVAFALGENMCPGYRNRGTLPSWQNLAKELVEGGADLHGLSDGGRYRTEPIEDVWLTEDTNPEEDGGPGRERPPSPYMTPLLCLLDGLSSCRFYWPEECLPQSPQTALTMWLEVLQASGVDLLKYGRKESKINASHSMERRFPFFLTTKEYDDDDEDYLELDYFTYGRSVADWQIPEYIYDSVLCSFQDFWSMVEWEMEIADISTPEMMMPGAWVF